MPLRTIAYKTRLYGLHRTYTDERSSSSAHCLAACVSIPSAKVVSP
jgi:hypothetical protein